MDRWSEIRGRVRRGELSLRQACREYGLNFRTVHKIVQHPEPPAFQPSGSRAKPSLDPVLPLIRAILDADRHAPPKQRHTARRIHDRLCVEHGYVGGASTVRAAVRALKDVQPEVFVPLVHPPGEAQCDFGRAVVVVAGERIRAALFVLTLPHSGARFGRLYPRECTEAFHDGHVQAFAFFGGVPTRITYDNSRLAVVKVTGPHDRRLTREFLRSRGHFAFASHFCRVRQAHEKGHVEGGVGYVRRDFLVPVPTADAWANLNARLAEACRRELDRRAAGRSHTAAEPLAADGAAFLPMPADPFEARRLEPVTINSLSLGRFDGNDYSVPTAYAYRTLTATGTPDAVRFTHRGTIVAEHRRCWGKRQTLFDPVHYLALLERKPGAFDHAAPLVDWALPPDFATPRRRLEEADPAGGTRQSIRVPRLLETHDLATVAAAVERALAPAVRDADAVRLSIQSSRERPVGDFDLTGRTLPAGGRVPPPDLTAHAALTTAKGGRS